MLIIKTAFERLKKSLKKIKPNCTLPDALFDYLWEVMEEITPSPNIPLVEQGRTPKFAYFIIRGFICAYYVDKNGDKQVKRFYKEDRITVFLSFLEKQPSPYTIVAGKDTLLSRISIADVDYIYANWAGMREFALLTVLEYETMKETLRDELLSLPGEQRVLRFYQEYPGLLHSKIFVDVDIASYLCLQRQTLCMLRAGLIAKGLLPKKQ